MGLTNTQQAILVALAFITVSIQGYLQNTPFVKSHETLQIFVLLIPAILFALKEAAGSAPQVGLLTDHQQAVLMTLAGILFALGAELSVQTTDPNYLFALGLLAAIVAGLKEFLGAVKTPVVPVPVPPPVP